MGKEVKFYKDYFKAKDFDFNLLANVIDTSNTSTVISSNYFNDYILESCFQVKDIQGGTFKGYRRIHPYFENIWKKLEEKHNSSKSRKSSIDIFFSFCAGGRSIAHEDYDDVSIFGLYGKTIYLINDVEYSIEKGDLIFIPKGTIHRAIGITPRIIGSYGTWKTGDRY
tara:strand:- start:89 stop:592 length:504 start_codon:yes stop_codon:yes gene_type:complete